MNKILVIDTETSGLPPEDTPFTTYISGPQILSLGAVVADKDDGYKVLSTFHTNIRFVGSHNGLQYGAYKDITWSDEAAKIHGLTPAILISAPYPIDACTKLLNFINQNFPDMTVVVAGHNPVFDIYFIKQLCFLAGLTGKIKIKHNAIDTSTIGEILYGKPKSNDLFAICSNTKRLGAHNSLEDALLANDVLIHASSKVKGIV